MAMGPINAAGTGSGIDVPSIVKDLVAAEGDPKQQKIDTDEAEALAKITAYGTLKGSLSDFLYKLEDLDELTDFEERTVTAEDEKVFTATVDSTAEAGVYDIEVVQLAKPNKVRTIDFGSTGTLLGTGILNIQVGAKLGSVSIIEGENSLTDIRNTINANSEKLGVSASVVTVDTGSRLILTANEAGSINIITVTVDDDDGNDTDAAGLSQLVNTNLVTIDSPLDSIVKIDGATLTKSSNTISDAISGVTFTILTTTAASVTKYLKTSINTSATVTKVEEFIKSYNNLIDTMKSLSEYKGTDEANGILLGDPTLRGLESGLRNQINSTISTVNSQVNILAEIGVTTNQFDGKLKLKTTTLLDQINKDHTAVGNLFASSEGMAKKLTTFIKNYTVNQGLIDNKENGLNHKILDLKKQRIALEDRLDSLEIRLYKQFSAMDRAVASLKNTSDFLKQAFESLPQPMNSRRK